VKIEEEKLIDELRKVLSNGLPGVKSQLKAAPPFRANSFTDKDVMEARKASVVFIIYPHDNKWEGVLIKRASYDGVHSKQIAMPGGEREPGDASDLETAIRECEEEIGVSLVKAQIIGTLSPLYIPPSRFFVRPYLAYLNAKPQFNIDPKEVGEVLFVSLERLCSDNLWAEFEIKGNKVPGFELDGNVVWGATAMMLAEISDCCRDIFRDTFAT
tara:strand:+ start:520 stop:1161 length:642 start_codon:yes stop_codon:yes gene_type:complete